MPVAPDFIERMILLKLNKGLRGASFEQTFWLLDRVLPESAATAPRAVRFLPACRMHCGRLFRKWPNQSNLGVIL